ncbi:hypothetical protein BDF19DRAFT_426130 [Syncephalis fuscata]|nr:hypothetical protein BDF19DRAFT_426130 [Syncephalis fuscata]
MDTIITNTAPQPMAESRLIAVLTALPSSDYWQFLLYLNGSTVARLSACCHLLKEKIRTDSLLWQYLYHNQFLNNELKVKEMDFVYWCTRSSPNTQNVPNSNKSSVIDWYDVYRRRIITEQNWRYGRGQRTVIPLPEPDKYKQWSIGNNSATGMILYGHAYGNNLQRGPAVVVIEGTPINNIATNLKTSAINDSSNMTLRPTLKRLESNELKDSNKNCITLMSNQYIVTVISCFYSSTVYMEIRERGSLNLKSTIHLPYRSSIQMIKGRWAMFIYREMTYNEAHSAKLMVWDIERGMACPGSIDDLGNTRSFHQVNEETAYVYVAKCDSATPTTIHWMYYVFSATESVRLVKQSSFQTSQRIVACLADFTFDSTRALIKTLNSTHQHQFFLHSIAADTQQQQQLSELLIPKNNAAIELVLRDISSDTSEMQSIVQLSDASENNVDMDNYVGCQTYEEIDRWSSSRCLHLIGQLCVFIELCTSGLKRATLVDVKTNASVRFYSPYATNNDCAFLMTSFICLVPNRNELVIVDYGAL